MNKKNLRSIFTLVCAICIFIGLGQVYAANEANSNKASDSKKSEQTVTEVMNLIHSLHNSGISEEELKEAAIQGMIDRLNDPYTEYMAPDEAQKYSDRLDNKQIGLGIQMEQRKEGIYVTGTLSGSPADKAGIKAGDKIVSLDGASIGDIPPFVKALSQKKIGDQVKLTVKRGTESKTFTLVLETLDIPVVEHQLLNGKIGYIQLASFTGDAAKKFETAITDLQGKGMRSLIIDLKRS